MSEQTYFDEPQIIAWFSCGVTSAVAAFLAAKEFPNCRVVNCNTLRSEHPDNVRFFGEVQRWIGRPIEQIQSKKYETVDEVFERGKFMAGVKGAKCTTELKKIPRLDFARPDDTHIFGFSADEGPRIKLFESRNPDLKLDWILQRRSITKYQCFELLTQAGIKEPVMYGLGFENNNCIACVKARSKRYWRRTRTHFPDVFKRRMEQARQLNCRLIKHEGALYFLHELDTLPDDSAEASEFVSCGPECGEQTT